MDALIGQTLETARQQFLQENESFYKFASQGDRKALEVWLNNTNHEPIKRAVGYAMSMGGVDDPYMEEMLEASMKFRVLAGILNRPIEYDPDNILSGGQCACQEYDPETGGWPCKVPDNQAQADAWHTRFGNGPACPFYENPQKLNPLERSESEIEKMIFDEEMDIEDAHRQLGLRHR